MFAESRPQRFNLALSGSLAAHAVLLLFLALFRPSPIFVTPSSLAMGKGNASYKLVYFAPVGEKNQPEPDEQKTLTARNSKLSPARKHKQQAIQQQANVAKNVVEDKDARAGSEYGSLFAGDYEGHDVRPAYPIVYPDPPVARWEIPQGFSGDVIVEVSIDKLGNVIDLRLLQGIGHGIDEKVLSTLRQWHYKPATMDGEPIAEKHDVHFHYPG